MTEPCDLKRVYQLRAVFIISFLCVTCMGARSDTHAPCSTNSKMSVRILGDGSIGKFDCNNKLVEEKEVRPEQSGFGELFPPGDLSDSDYQKYRHARFESEENDLTYRANVFAWQYFSSKVIFCVVVILVLSGLCFSAVQFGIAMRAQFLSLAKVKKTVHKLTATEGQAQAGPDSLLTTATTIEASLKGIKITSSVLGLLVLAISMGFFYLYLVFVYPIRIIGG
jgi:hypothetical protein